MDRMDDKLDSTIAKTNEISNEQMELRSENQELKTQVTDLESKVAYLEGQSKRNNLMFHGIPESRDERKILDRNLEMPNASADSEVPIERAHCMGKYSRDKTRPIVVKFLNYKHKNAILMNKVKLKGRKYRIQEQFSEKITNERKSFQPLIEEAMADEKRFFVKYNKLVIDDKTYMYDHKTKSVQLVK